MSRLLHAPVVDGPTRRLDAPAAVLDQATKDLLGRAEAEAHARGRAEGQREAREAAERAAQQATAAMVSAVDRVRGVLQEEAAERAQATVALARRLAEAILGHELQAGGSALVDRVVAAAAALDHGPFTVHVAGVDADLVGDHAAELPPDTTVAVDTRLAPGEARITGPWSAADLTHEAMLDALVEAST